MQMRPRVELITFGDELLMGLRNNGHLQYLGAELSRRDLPIFRNTVISDDYQTIANHLNEYWHCSDILITTGGLGPTSDDNTREAIAEAIGLPLEFDERAYQNIEKLFEPRGLEIGDRQKKQCFKPRGADILHNRFGTAPGIYLKNGDKRLIMLPGPGHELKTMFEQEVLPRLAQEGFINSDQTFLQLRTLGIPEGEIESYLEPVLHQYPQIQTAYCATQGLVDIRLHTNDTAIKWPSLKKIGRECAEALGENFICFGHCSLARYVIDQMRSMEKTIATAESCTGGLLSSAFTDVQGASKTFTGGAVCYCNDAKVQILDMPECILQQHGAVSSETAVAMATGAAERYSSDYGLSITGYAGPDGGTPDNPIGTIYIGYHSPIGAWAHKMVLPGDRLSIKARAVNTALDLMRRKICKYKLAEFLCCEDMPSSA